MITKARHSILRAGEALEAGIRNQDASCAAQGTAREPHGSSSARTKGNEAKARGGRAAAGGTHGVPGEHQEDLLCSPVPPALPPGIKPQCSALLSHKLGAERDLGTNLRRGTQGEPLLCRTGQAEPQHQPSHLWEGRGKSSNDPNLICPTRAAGRSCTVAFLMSQLRGTAAPGGAQREQRQIRAAPLTDPDPIN